MKITKEQLKQIIKEEMIRILNENNFEFAGGDGQIIVKEQGVIIVGRDGKPALAKDGNVAVMPMEIAQNYDVTPQWLIDNLKDMDEDGGAEGSNIDGWYPNYIADAIDEALEEVGDDDDYDDGGRAGPQYAQKPQPALDWGSRGPTKKIRR